MNDTERRIKDLERRIRSIEDEARITRLILSYGPLVDSGNARAVADLWESDGIYDVDELYMSGSERIEAMVRSRPHQEWISGGCAHLVGPPHVTVTGDTASAVGYTVMIVRGAEAEGFRIRRVTANHWRLRESEGEWKVVQRTNRVLDGRTESPELLAKALGLSVHIG